MNKHFYRIMMSNLRATRAQGQQFTIDSFPCWGDQQRYEWARYLAYNVLDWDIALNVHYV